MKVMVAKTLGYCFGVRRAEQMLISSLEECGQLKTYGPLINNMQVTSRYEAQGARIVTSVDEVESGETMVIRSHGLPRSVYESAEQKQIRLVDATCPYVSKIHKIVQESYRNGIPVVIFGSADHPEVIGINGWCGNSASVVMDVDEISPSDSPVCIVVQTTFNHVKWAKYRPEILKKLPQARIYDTICSATADRQESAVDVAKQVDRMIVIGDRKSSDTKKLFELCSGYTETVLIETKDELNMKDFRGVESVGITAGASTPHWIIEAVILKIEEERNVE